MRITRLIVSTLVAFVALLSSAQAIKHVAADFSAYKPLFETLGLDVVSYDITGLSEQKYDFAFEIREYSKDCDSLKLVSQTPLVSLSNLSYISDFPESSRNEIRESGNAYDLDKDIYTLADKVNIGICPDFKNDTIVKMIIDVAQMGTLTMQRRLKEQHGNDGYTILNYEVRPFLVDEFVPGKFIPMALYGSWWWDDKFNIFRFCGDSSISSDLSSEIVSNIPHFYVIGATVSPAKKKGSK